MIKRLKYIFIPVLAILLMSHNVSAAEMAPNVHPIWANANPLCSFYIPATDVWQNNAFSNNTSNQTYSVSKINCDYPQGLNTVKTYAVYSFRVDNFAYDNSSDSGWLASKVSSVSGSADWGVVGQTISSAGATSWQVDLYLYSTKASNGGTFQIYNPIYANELMYLKPQERIYFLGASYWQVTTETDLEYNYTDVLNAINNKLSDIYNIREILRNDIRPSIWSINDKLDDLSQDTADAINDGQSDATQDAADDSSTAGDSSSSDAESATSSLLNVIGTGIGAITTASPTNCRINGNMGNLNIGNIDLCANPVPAFVSVIGSIIAVLVVLPLVIVLFNRFIGIIRSFQK